MTKALKHRNLNFAATRVLLCSLDDDKDTFDGMIVPSRASRHRGAYAYGYYLMECESFDGLPVLDLGGDWF